MLAHEEIPAVQVERIPVQAPAGISPKMVSEYVNRCLANVPAAVAALDRSDYELLRIFGHRLKGSGGAYGIQALTSIGAGIEAAAIGSDRAGLRRQVAELEECLSRIDILSP